MTEAVKGRGRTHVALLGVSGNIGFGLAEVLAAAGCQIAALARERGAAEQAVARAQAMARSESIPELIVAGTYERDFDDAISRADLIFDALADDPALKRKYLMLADGRRRPDSILVTLTCRHLVEDVAAGLTPAARRNLVGLRLFNPPHVYGGAEIVPNRETAADVLDRIVTFMRTRMAREAIVPSDSPGFAATRSVLGALAQAAAAAPATGVAQLDYLLGAHSGFGARAHWRRLMRSDGRPLSRSAPGWARAAG